VLDSDFVLVEHPFVEEEAPDAADLKYGQGIIVVAVA
jgi:hypothetical protein